MTNKMPVVGKRYRKKSDLNLPHCNIECVGFQRSFKELYAFRFYNEENPHRIDIFSLNYFLENYEEIPEDKIDPINNKDISELLKQIRVESHIKLNHINRFLTKKIDWVFEDSSLDDKIDLLYKYISDITEDKIETECSVGKKFNCKRCGKEFLQRHRSDYYCSNYLLHYQAKLYS